MTNEYKKKQLIITLKRLQPDQIYVSEFLIQARLKLYHQLRVLAKSNKDKILRVFTRNGNIMYKNAITNEVKIVSSKNDIINIQNSLLPS